MTDQSTETPKTPSATADDAVARFEARMADDKSHEDRNRPARDAGTTIEATMAYINKQLVTEKAKLDRGSFHMASQELAQKETVRELGWLLEDLAALKPGS